MDGCAYIHTYKKLSSFNPIVSITIMNLVKRHSIDLIHIHDSHSHNYFITAAYLGLKVPAVLSRRVDFPPSTKSKYNHPSIKSIICVSDHVRNIIKPILNNPEVACVIHDGVDLDKKNTDDYGFRLRYNISPDTILVANISAIADHKDYPTFIRTAERVLQSGYDVKFVIIGGDAGEEENIKKLIIEKRLLNKVIITGYQPEAHRILNEVDIFLFTSKEEGFGSTLLDAMLYNVPVVATSVGGVPEMITHNHNGLLCPIGDDQCLSKNIITLIENKSLSDNIISNEQKAVGKFSADNMASKTLLVYQEILNIT
jgi:glycosyltransferase involved in cell wall biosynthesis